MAALIASGYRLGHSFARCSLFSPPNLKKLMSINMVFALVVQKIEGAKKIQMYRSHSPKSVGVRNGSWTAHFQ